MELWSDPTIFQSHSAVLCRENGACRVYESGSIRNTRQIFREVTANLGCKLMTHSFLAEKRFLQYREKQDFDSFEYIISGRFFIRSGDKMIRAEAGDLIFLPQGEDNMLLYLPEYGPCEKYGFIPDGRIYGSLRELFGLREFRCLSFGENSRMKNLFGLLWEKAAALEGSVSEEEWGGIIFEFLDAASKTSASHSEPPLLKEIRRYMEEHLGEVIRLPLLAAKFNLNSFQLLALFREHLHTTPNQYLIRRRMARAAVLLGDSDLRIGEIAFAVGYSDPLYFSTEFRRYHKLSPRQYRAALKEKSVY